jgi:hypothetical protein
MRRVAADLRPLNAGARGGGPDVDVAADCKSAPRGVGGLLQAGADVLPVDRQGPRLRDRRVRCQLTELGDPGGGVGMGGEKLREPAPLLGLEPLEEGRQRPRRQAGTGQKANAAPVGGPLLLAAVGEPVEFTGLGRQTGRREEANEEAPAVA